MKKEDNDCTWLIIIIAAIIAASLLSCTKPDCPCGHIIRNTNNGTEWTVVIENDCDGSLDSTVWHFDMSDCLVGDVVCELHEVELDSCKR